MIYFIGAGPGDPELMTIKGKRLVDTADVIIYAGSLVNPTVLQNVSPSCAIYNSAEMSLEEILQIMIESHVKGKQVVRLHTGDPSIYGAIREQTDALETADIPYAVVPGVSSFLAAAAALKAEYTLPEVSQTVILTRMEGRTSVPEKEHIPLLAKHQATMVMFLSVDRITQLTEQLRTSYPINTPVAVVYKASWPDEQIVTGTLETIAEKVQTSGIRKTALIVVGNCLGDQYAKSKLYDKTFTHGYRQGESK